MTLTHKDLIRQKVWPELRQWARPDSRFGYDFSSFIAGFQGEERATDRLVEAVDWKNINTIFITPDNCLETLRLNALETGKTVLVTTYGIKRGFYILSREWITKREDRVTASLLDGMERTGLGRHITLTEMKRRGIKVDLMVTGTGAINQSGVRFGKGHGFFDLEWGMLFSIGAVDVRTCCAALVHDCQILNEDFQAEIFDTSCDIVATPTRTIVVEGSKSSTKPTCGILWSELRDGMLEDIPPLQELKTMLP